MHPLIYYFIIIVDNTVADWKKLRTFLGKIRWGIYKIIVMPGSGISMDYLKFLVTCNIVCRASGCRYVLEKMQRQRLERRNVWQEWMYRERKGSRRYNHCRRHWPRGLQQHPNNEIRKRLQHRRHPGRRSWHGSSCEESHKSKGHLEGGGGGSSALNVKLPERSREETSWNRPDHILGCGQILLYWIWAEKEARQGK